MTFDLEKARDVCAGMERFRGQTIQCTHIEAHLAAAMLPEALAEIERLRAIIDNPVEEIAWKMDLDILKSSNDDAELYLARKWHAAYRKAQNSNLVRKQEIERLRADNAGLSKAVIDIQEERDLAQANFRAYYKEWEEQAADIERLRAASIEYQNALDDVQNLKEQIETFHLRRENELRQMNEISWQNKTQAARIKELDGMLDARSKEIVGRIQECQACQIDQLRAEGKIGPDTSKPRSWKITEERKAALETAEFAVSHLAGCYPDCERILGKPDQRVAKVLRAMLEANQ